MCRLRTLVQTAWLLCLALLGVVSGCGEGTRNAGIESYDVPSATTLEFGFYTDDCSETVGSPEAVETRASVTLTVRLRKKPECGDLAAEVGLPAKLVTVELAAPLGDRVVLDGSQEGRRVPRVP